MPLLLWASRSFIDRIFIAVSKALVSRDCGFRWICREMWWFGEIEFRVFFGFLFFNGGGFWFWFWREMGFSREFVLGGGSKRCFKLNFICFFLIEFCLFSYFDKFEYKSNESEFIIFNEWLFPTALFFMWSIINLHLSFFTILLLFSYMKEFWTKNHIGGPKFNKLSWLSYNL